MSFARLAGKAMVAYADWHLNYLDLALIAMYLNIIDTPCITGADE
jgi:prepilin-type processing-associated H-X9-DG protein